MYTPTSKPVLSKIKQLFTTDLIKVSSLNAVATLLRMLTSRSA